MTQKGGGHGPVVKREECSQTGGSRLSAPLAFFIGSSTVFSCVMFWRLKPCTVAVSSVGIRSNPKLNHRFDWNPAHLKL